MIVREKKYNTTAASVAGVDFEWTKNYRIKNGSVPFCFSVVYFDPPTHLAKIESVLEIGFYLAYIEDIQEIESLLVDANEKIRELYKTQVTIVGHQLCSDLAVALNYSEQSLEVLSRLRGMHKSRKNTYLFDSQYQIFDTRYDMDNFLDAKSRRLVDVCCECNLDVEQPELVGSMTKMQNEFLASQDSTIMEKIAVLNLRHSFSTALLYCIYSMQKRPNRQIKVNRILQRNLDGVFDYVNSDKFQALL
jgi:hypothetical protein